MIIEFIKNVINKILDVIFAVMPTSPFASYIQSVGEIPAVKYINWFIPVGVFVDIGIAWLTAIALWYIYVIALRWIKAAGG